MARILQKGQGWTRKQCIRQRVGETNDLACIGVSSDATPIVRNSSTPDDPL
jgi:hypothetical protein